jgi:NADPH2:quinone reductase
MHAIGFETPLPIGDPKSLIDLELPRPAPQGRDLLVEIRAIAVNPVDTKRRRSFEPEPGKPRILGWDAAGIVRETGPEAELFKAGDAVFYAGDLTRQGCNAELQCVDERLVGRKPGSVDWADAAALPLTSITAWETLFDRLRIKEAPVPGAAPAILIVGGAGGVGSIAIQLARQLTDLTVIATASRPETRDWALSLGAHHVIDHAKPLAGEVAALDIGAPAFVFSTTNSGDHLAQIAEVIAPQGRFALIDDPAGFDVMPFKRKSVSIHWEFMFTRSMFATADIAAQGRLLNEVAALVDAGTLRTTRSETLTPINAANLKRAHAMIESGRTRGKVTLEGF